MSEVGKHQAQEMFVQLHAHESLGDRIPIQQVWTGA